MANEPRKLSPDLESKIGQVALQLRQAEAMRRWIRFGAATLALTILCTFLLRHAEPLGFSRNGALAVFAASVFGMFAAMVWAPLRRPISSRSVALFIDERHPELENRILTAVEFSGKDAPPGASVYMIERCLEESRDFTRRFTFGDLVDGGAIVRLFGAAAFFIALSLAVMLARRDLWIPKFGLAGGAAAPAAETPDFTVEPGDVRIRVGESQVVLVHSSKPGRKALIEWKAEEGEWRAEPMLAAAAGDVHHHRFENVQADLSYRVRVGRRESKEFMIATWIPPEVESINLTYHYPEYIGWPSREVPNGGNITAVEGSRVDIAVDANKALKSAEIAFKSGKTIALEKALDTRWTAKLDVAEDDKYEVRLVDLEGNASEYNREYKIVAQPDKPPTIKIEFPRGDQEANAIEEVPFELKVSDDFGLQDFGIQYEVAGGKTGRIDLKPEAEAVLAAEGEHTIELENIGLTAGDLITWTVYAKDSKPDRAAEDELGDLFFLEIRPFQREYEEAVSQGGGQAGQDTEEAGDQKEIVLAIFNLNRRAKKSSEEKFKEDKAAILDAQLKLMEKFQQGDDPLGNGRKGELEAVVKAMAGTVAELEKAALPDPSEALTKAGAAAREAYRAILKLADSRIQVQQAMAMGQGGQRQQNRPDIGELEMNRNKNFYEEEKTTQAEQEQVEKALSRVKELAQRQKIINKEIAKLISELSQAKTEAERKEIERRLEKLREEEKKNLERLDDSQKDLSQAGMDSQQAREARMGLEDAREQMNRSLENMQPDRLQQARLAGTRAADALNEIEEQLQDLSRSAAADRMKRLQERMAELRKKQDEVAKKIDELSGGKDSSSLRPAGSGEETRDGLAQQKAAVTEEYQKLMDDASDLAEKSAQSQELMSRKLGDWLRDTSRDGIMEDMQESEPLVRYGVWDSAAESEKKIQEKLAKAAAGLDEAARAMATDDLAGMQKALDELNEILDNQRQRAETADAGKQGEQGEKSETGEKGDKGSASGKEPGKQGSRGGEKGERSGETGSEPGNATEGKGEKASAGEGEEPTEEQKERARRLVAEARKDLAAGKGERASDKLRQALAEDPSNPDANTEQGKLEAAQGDHESALESFDKALKSEPGNNEAAQGAAQAKEELEKGQSREAASADGEKPGERGSKPGEKGEQGEQGEKGDKGRQGKAGDEPGDGQGEGEQGKEGEGKAKGEGKQGNPRGQGNSPGQTPGEQGQRGESGESGDASGSVPSDDGRPGPSQGRGGRESGRQLPPGHPQDATDEGGSQPSGGGASRGANPNARGGWVGADDWSALPPDFPKEFMERDYADWVSRLRNAEALLPKESFYRQSAERIRNRIEEMQRDYTRHSLAPKFDLLLSDVLKPLAETAGQLELEIMKALKAKEFVLTDDGEVPAQYRKRVADYFEALSAGEGRP